MSWQQSPAARETMVPLGERALKEDPLFIVPSYHHDRLGQPSGSLCALCVSLNAWIRCILRSVQSAPSQDGIQISSMTGAKKKKRKKKRNFGCRHAASSLASSRHRPTIVLFSTLPQLLLLSQSPPFFFLS